MMKNSKIKVIAYDKTPTNINQRKKIDNDYHGRFAQWSDVLMVSMYTYIL
jgi:hypothetical protein